MISNEEKHNQNIIKNRNKKLTKNDQHNTDYEEQHDEEEKLLDPKQQRSEETDEEGEKKVDEAVTKTLSLYERKTVVAVVGKSENKAKIINQLLGFTDADSAPVKVEEGKKASVHKLSDNFVLLDAPSLNDDDLDGSDITKELVKEIDFAILIPTGSGESDSETYKNLKEQTSQVYVIGESETSEQLSKALGDVTVYTSEKYGELRDAITNFLTTSEKDIFFYRHLSNDHKVNKVNAIIAGTTLVTAAEALLPFSAAFICASQITAVVKLNYMYRGRVLTKKEAFAFLPGLFSGAPARTAFLIIKSFLPTTILLEAVGVVVAASYTSSLLLAVKLLFESGRDLEEKRALRKVFDAVDAKLVNTIKTSSSDDLKSLEWWSHLIEKVTTQDLDDLLEKEDAAYEEELEKERKKKEEEEKKEEEKRRAEEEKQRAIEKRKQELANGAEPTVAETIKDGLEKFADKVQEAFQPKKDDESKDGKEDEKK
ncbi:hypothetical protein AKO1_003809 [Acrasis kona]|uniref:Uncharacterized protein n=1 Tax=Acrasis kona TaxID=1008807 RepID=A0AAW2Z6F8_9EUKA